MIHKSILYDIFCENFERCDGWENHTEVNDMYKKSPVSHYKKKGYRKINNRWYCPKCVEEIKHMADKLP